MKGFSEPRKRLYRTFRIDPPLFRLPFYPGLLFLGLFEKHQGKPPKHQGFSSPCEPLETLESKQKTPQKTEEIPSIVNSGHVRPRQGTEICNFGAPSPLEALHWIFGFFSSFYVQFSKTSPLKSGESSEKSSGENRVKSCHVCGCHGFFGPEKHQGNKNIKEKKDRVEFPY